VEMVETMIHKLHGFFWNIYFILCH
jgi:hypothetical protein